MRTAGGAPAGGSAKITVSNLHYGVSDADIIVSLEAAVVTLMIVARRM